MVSCAETSHLHVAMGASDSRSRKKGILPRALKRYSKYIMLPKHFLQRVLLRVADMQCKALVQRPPGLEAYHPSLLHTAPTLEAAYVEQ